MKRSFCAVALLVVCALGFFLLSGCGDGADTRILDGGMDSGAQDVNPYGEIGFVVGWGSRFLKKMGGAQNPTAQ
ncbi:MAG: hypothetical protein HY897_07680 [Deltaproteobacteria bacterium]|nr:hypothetical protein [Deltaproteobacteria bacterium]